MAQSKRTTTRKKTTKKKIAKKSGEGIRIHELSRELKEAKDAVLEAAARLRIPATSHLSMVTEEQAQRIRNAFGSTPRAPKKAAKKQAGKKSIKRPPVTATAKTSTTTAGGKKKASTRVVVTQDLGKGKVGNPRLKMMCMQFLEGCGC